MRTDDGSPVAQARRDEDPFERALTDPDFLSAVTAAHRGAWPVLDALWWCRHPAEAAPSGRPSPTARLAGLQRRMFAADGDAAGDRVVADALRQLETEIGVERAAINAAIDAAIAGAQGGIAPPPVSGPAEPAPTAGRDPATDPPADVLAGSLADPPDHLPPDGRTLAPGLAAPRRRLQLGAGLIGALLLGAGVGSQLGSASRSDTPAPTAAASGSPLPAAPVLAAQVFARVQTGQDIPRVPLPAAYDPASFRYLGSAGWRDADANGVTDSPYYAVRGASNMVCLVVVPEGAGYLTTCTLEADFPRGGLSLSWQSADVLPAQDSARAPMVMDITVTWLPDSTIETRGSSRAPLP